jgi:uncharacterized coiled-coil protein SlyX
MYTLIQLKTTTPSGTNSTRSSPLRRVFVLIPLLLACFGLSATMQAVTPAPDGGYSGNNTAEGSDALFSRTTGAWNTAVGFQALHDDTTGNTSVAVGFKALHSNNADYNTAVGSQALLNDTTGEGNIAIGGNAGINITEGDDNIDIGHPGSVGDDGVIRLGRQGVQAKTYIGGISGVPVVGAAVAITDKGQLGIAQISSARFKEKIRPMDKASEAILALKPVTFRYKKELDPEGATRFGLVAEDVARVNPDLVTLDRDGKPYTVRYDAVNVMLLNEFLKEHRAVRELSSTAAKQEARIALQDQQIKSLTAALKEQATQIQKVSAQVETTKPAPQVVVNH